MRSDTFKDSVVPAKYKILSALAIVVATKCEPCIIGYTKMAYEAGAKEAELVEFLNVAITEAGCPGEQWAILSLHLERDYFNGFFRFNLGRIHRIFDAGIGLSVEFGNVKCCEKRNCGYHPGCLVNDN